MIIFWKFNKNVSNGPDDYKMLLVYFFFQQLQIAVVLNVCEWEQSQFLKRQILVNLTEL